MKAKIFGKLKQEYSSLGLGDEVLMARAESLAALGLVTDDNIDAVVAAQRSDLEGLQKRYDKRVTDALAKEREKHQTELEAKIKEAEEKLRKELEGKQLPPDKPTPPEDPRLGELEKKLEELISKRDEDAKAGDEKRKALEKQVTELLEKNAAMEREKAAAAFHAKIVAKAKELGVPQWRIDEGFTIASDATDEAIAETLGKVANNIRANALPQRNNFPINPNEKPDESELKELAAKLV